MRLQSWRTRMPLVHLGAILFFALLVLFDFKVAFHQTGGPVNFFGLSIANSEAYARWAVTDVTGARFVAIRSDVWNCYRLRENMVFDIFTMVTVPERCQEQYYVVVQTEACLSSRLVNYIECSPGTWRWAPNPPCGTDSPTGWWLPPC
jgi:hypothetical protein